VGEIRNEKHALMPWETPADEGVTHAEEIGMAEPPERSLEETVRAIQADIAFAVRYTAILVCSNNEALCMVANTVRGQDMPPGGCTFTDGSEVTFRDIGMPQPGVPLMTVQELARAVADKALAMGLVLA